MEEALRAVLAAAAPVSALTGPRIGWRMRPQGTGEPAVVLHVVAALSGITLKGPDGYQTHRVQADCIGGTFPAALAVSRAVKEALHGYRGTVSGYRIDGVFHVGEGPGENGETDPSPYSVVRLDFEVFGVAA
jgi:hypothetical protein